jgi:hypothetical protein
MFGLTRGVGGGQDHTAEDALVTKSLSSYTNERVKEIGEYGMAWNTNLVSARFPNATEVKYQAFMMCEKLDRVELPKAETIGVYAFYSCEKLQSVDLDAAKKIGSDAFNDCQALISVTLPAAESIGSNAFFGCTKLAAVYLPGNQVATLGSQAFNSTPMMTSDGWSQADGTILHGKIYVPSDLLSSYKAATNWADYADQIVAIE